MMGVYIPNIKIPEKCSKCRDTGLKFAIDELGLKCPERKEFFSPTEADIKGIRRPDCPLVPVTEPHGDLIERKAVEELAQWVQSTDEDQIIWVSDLNDVPTIIPAEGGDAE